MDTFKCDRCGKYYLENNDELNKPLIYIGYDDIDLCDDCIGALLNWMNEYRKENEDESV